MMKSYGVKYNQEMAVWVIRSVESNHKRVVSPKEVAHILSEELRAVFQEAKSAPSVEFFIIPPI